MGQTLRARAQDAAARPPKFKLRYAPHPGMFKASAGDQVIDQIKFAADQGFTGWEDNGLPGQPPEMQQQIGKTLSDFGMKMGVFVAYANFDEPVFATNDMAKHEEVFEEDPRRSGHCETRGHAVVHGCARVHGPASPERQVE
jgi:hypothetical protein